MTERAKTDEWYTQRKDFETWCSYYNIKPKLDPFGRVHSMCEEYLMDAFTEEWLYDTYRREDVFYNPPLLKSMTKKSVLRAWEQYKKHDINMLGILPAGVISRAYFKPIWDEFKNGSLVDIEPIRPRPCFEYKGEPANEQARNDYIMLFFAKSKP